MFKDLLQGKPLRHPLHPFLAHFPVGLFVLSLLLDVASLAFPSVAGLVRGAYYSMLAGVISALMAAIPGFVDYTDIRRDHPARRVATAHMILNLGLRSVRMDESPVPWPPLIVSILGIAVLSVSGYLGGHLVYDDGIGVGRHRRRTATPQQTLQLSTSGMNKDERLSKHRVRVRYRCRPIG